MTELCRIIIQSGIETIKMIAEPHEPVLELGKHANIVVANAAATDLAGVGIRY